jgi:hypothetical protein
MRGSIPHFYSSIVLLFLGGLSPREQTNFLGSLRRQLSPTCQYGSAPLLSRKRGTRKGNKWILTYRNRSPPICGRWIFLCKYPSTVWWPFCEISCSLRPKANSTDLMVSLLLENAHVFSHTGRPQKSNLYRPKWTAIPPHSVGKSWFSKVQQ